MSNLIDGDDFDMPATSEGPTNRRHTHESLSALNDTCATLTAQFVSMQEAMQTLMQRTVQLQQDVSAQISALQSDVHQTCTSVAAAAAVEPVQFTFKHDKVFQRPSLFSGESDKDSLACSKWQFFASKFINLVFPNHATNASQAKAAIDVLGSCCQLVHSTA